MSPVICVIRVYHLWENRESKCDTVPPKTTITLHKIDYISSYIYFSFDDNGRIDMLQKFYNQTRTNAQRSMSIEEYDSPYIDALGCQSKDIRRGYA